MGKNRTIRCGTVGHTMGKKVQDFQWDLNATGNPKKFELAISTLEMVEEVETHPITKMVTTMEDAERPLTDQRKAEAEALGEELDTYKGTMDVIDADGKKKKFKGQIERYIKEETTPKVVQVETTIRVPNRHTFKTFELYTRLNPSEVRKFARNYIATVTAKDIKPKKND